MKTNRKLARNTEPPLSRIDWRHWIVLMLPGVPAASATVIVELLKHALK